MSDNENFQNDSSSALGPLIGIRRPRYDILDSTLGPFSGRQPKQGDTTIFVNVGSILRQFFSEYSTARLTRSELERNPRTLASELINMAAHYRNYLWKYHGRNTTILMYYSTEYCDFKLGLDPDYKKTFYEKRMPDGSEDYTSLRRYVEFNLRTATAVAKYIPNLHIVNTGKIDPEAWPWIYADMNPLSDGGAVIISTWNSDIQYLLKPGDVEFAYLRAAGDKTALVTYHDLIADSLRSTKTAEKYSAILKPEHFMYMLALAGDSDLSVAGINKVGLGRAAAIVAKRVEQGFLPANSVNLQSLLEECDLKEDAKEAVSRVWSVLVHDDYAGHVSEDDMLAISEQMVNQSSLGTLEQINSQYFSNVQINVEMIFAGEDY